MAKQNKLEGEVQTLMLQLAGFFAQLGKVILEMAKEVGGDAPAATNAKAPKKGKKVEAEEEEEDLDDVEDVEEEDEEEAEEEDEEEDGEDEEEEEDEEDEVIDEAQLKKLKAALRAYSDKNTKAKAVKVLMKFAPISEKVKSADFKKVMAALKV